VNGRTGHEKAPPGAQHPGHLARGAVELVALEVLQDRERHHAVEVPRRERQPLDVRAHDLLGGDAEARQRRAERACSGLRSAPHSSSEMVASEEVADHVRRDDIVEGPALHLGRVEGSRLSP